MTLTIPTASSVKMRFPEFSSVGDSAVEFAIEEARVEFGNGDNWDNAATLALLYLVAHFVSCSIARASGDGGEGQIQSESYGRFSVTYAKTSDPAATPGDKDSSTYGRRYLELVSANFSGAQIV